MLHIDLQRALRGLCPWLIGAAAGTVASLLVPVAGLTHEGHDHGPAQSLAGGPVAPRVAARSEVYELVGILRGERLIIYLDRFATNEPVTAAKIAVTIGDAADPIDAEPAADGTYSVSSPRFQAAGEI